MKNLTKLLFCIFAFTAILACEPEEIPETSGSHETVEVNPYGYTGDQEEVIDDRKN